MGFLNLKGMFEGCTFLTTVIMRGSASFLSGVTDMSRFFKDTPNLNYLVNFDSASGQVSSTETFFESWGPYLGNVKNMSQMFYNSPHMVVPTTTWDVSSVLENGFDLMFSGATAAQTATPDSIRTWYRSCPLDVFMPHPVASSIRTPNPTYSPCTACDENSFSTGL